MREAHKKMCIRINSSSIPDDNVIWLDGSCAGILPLLFSVSSTRSLGRSLVRTFIIRQINKFSNDKTCFFACQMYVHGACVYFVPHKFIRVCVCDMSDKQ